MKILFSYFQVSPNAEEYIEFNFISWILQNKLLVELKSKIKNIRSTLIEK